ELWFDGLADLLLPMLTPASVLELNIDRLEGLLEGSTPQERFRCFVERLRRPERTRAFLCEYPVLAQLLLDRIDDWVDGASELLDRLASDWRQLTAAFGDGDLGELVRVRGGLADPHRGGRSVCILTFRSGVRIVYKPKPLAIDAHFQDLLRWLNAR